MNEYTSNTVENSLDVSTLSTLQLMKAAKDIYKNMDEEHLLLRYQTEIDVLTNAVKHLLPSQKEHNAGPSVVRKSNRRYNIHESSSAHQDDKMGGEDTDDINDLVVMDKDIKLSPGFNKIIFFLCDRGITMKFVKNINKINIQKILENAKGKLIIVDDADVLFYISEKAKELGRSCVRSDNQLIINGMN